MKKIIIAAATVALGMTSQAAFAETFSGPYVGAEISRDAYEVQADGLDLGGIDISADGLSGNGVAGGVYAGYDLKFSTMFVGLEANFDYSSASISASGTDGADTLSASIKARESYGVSGRFGATINDSTGVYAKLGWRATRFKIEAKENSTVLFAEGRTKSAFVYGAGLESYISNNASVRIEYTIADYGSAGLNQDFGVTGINVTNSKVAAGLSFRF